MYAIHNYVKAEHSCVVCVAMALSVTEAHENIMSLVIMSRVEASAWSVS